MEISEPIVSRMLELADYLDGARWPYGSGRFPDSERYQLQHAKRESQEIKQLLLKEEANK